MEKFYIDGMNNSGGIDMMGQDLDDMIQDFRDEFQNQIVDLYENEHHDDGVSMAQWCAEMETIASEWSKFARECVNEFESRFNYRLEIM
jgi:hypothetical protein